MACERVGCVCVDAIYAETIVPWFEGILLSELFWCSLFGDGCCILLLSQEASLPAMRYSLNGLGGALSSF